MLGTKWVAPGEGATGQELSRLLPKAFPGRFDAWSAMFFMSKPVAENPDRCTNLALTGEPLTDYDLRRIAVCE